MDDIPEMNVHISGTPDVPDIVHPGDWIAITDEIGDTFGLVVKVFKTKEGKWDHCPGAESWSIQAIGIGYLMKEENLSKHDCFWLNNKVAVDGEIVELYKLGWNEKEKIRVVPNPGYKVTKSAISLIKRMNIPLQLSLF